MTIASFTEWAMTQQPLFGDAPISALPPAQDASSTLIASLATRLTAWRHRAKQARDFRGFDQRQLRDLGINHFDQW